MEIEVSKEVAPAYVAHVLPILQNAKFQQLGRYTHHFWTNRLMHSLNVSYLSWRMADLFGADASVAARAGLLHDFCLYDFHEKTPTGEHQAFYHPKVAAKNSKEVFQISEREWDAILSHMFPLGPLPRNKEAWIIKVADKICALMEVCHIAIALARRNRVMFVSA